MYVPFPAKTHAPVMREAGALVDAGYQVTIVDFEHDQDLRKAEVVKGITFSHILMPPRDKKNYTPRSILPWLSFKVKRLLEGTWRVVRTPADVYHGHDIMALPPCFLAAALRCKKLVFDSHELPLAQRHILARPALAKMTRQLLRFLLPRCDSAIVPSAPLAHEMQSALGGPLARVIRSNIPAYESPGRHNRIRAALGLGAEVKIALYQGIFERNRSLDVLVRAAKYLDPGHVIVLMGKGSEQEALERQITEDGVADRVKMLPFVPNDELLAWTSSADLGLTLFSPDESLSIRYCLPNKLFEYIMAGLPILTTPLDSIVELVRQYDLGVVVPDLSPESIGQAINATMRDTASLERYRQHALAAALADLQWEKESAKLVDLYDHLTGSSS